MEKTKQESHSKERIDFQDRYVDMIVHTKGIGEIIEDYTSRIHKELYELSDGQLIMLVEGEWIASDGIYAIAQWEKFIEFSKYVEENK